jgi:hypothetical protein
MKNNTAHNKGTILGYDPDVWLPLPVPGVIWLPSATGSTV